MSTGGQEEEPAPLKFGAAPAYLHYNPERVDYAISDAELSEFGRCVDNLWKDFCLVCGSIGVPCALNAISEASAMAEFKVTFSFNLNLVVGLLGILLAVAFGIAWKKTAKNASAIIQSIRNKPRIRLN